MTVNSIPGHQNVADAACIGGVQGALTVGTIAVPARVGTENANRKLLTVYNNSKHTIYWGWNEDVTVATGTPIDGYDMMIFHVNKDMNVYLVAAANRNTRITEAI